MMLAADVIYGASSLQLQHHVCPLEFPEYEIWLTDSLSLDLLLLTVFTHTANPQSQSRKEMWLTGEKYD